MWFAERGLGKLSVSGELLISMIFAEEWELQKAFIILMR